MDFGLLEYALWVALGLWAILFVDNIIPRVVGLVLIVLTVLRAMAERDTPEDARRSDTALGRDQVEKTAPEGEMRTPARRRVL
ncbi:MAG: hypothetical protein K6U08_06265 [Firmicutes bacterium]|nr:hypothetical protein [Bacillota bacterium]